MTPYFADEHLTVYHGDTRAVMAYLEPESVHCVVTSPPYWGLRDYGTAMWVGGDETCDHKAPFRPRSERPNVSGSGIGATGYKGQEPKFGSTCGKCGATRQDAQLGLEPTPEQYVENMVAVFREVRRVLRKDGTVWLNLGDSYASGEIGRHDGRVEGNEFGAAHPGPRQQVRLRSGLKPKDLVGIPWRVAFALQADGWYLRSDIIWSKPNPMPESVTDRPTKSHEYLFLLAKSARYFYDAEAVAEETSTGTAGQTGGAYAPPGQPPASDARPSVARGGFSGKTEALPGRNAFRAITERRNLRSVWTVATQPYPGAHFATFPRKLIEPCIKAGTSERGVCPDCGLPWRRVIESEVVATSASPRYTGNGDRNDAETTRTTRTTRTTSWIPSCAHGAEPVPAVVLDPFAGSGTTGLVANALGRRAVLIDLSMDYLGQIMVRNAQKPLGLLG